MDDIQTITAICEALSLDKASAAREIAQQHFPFDRTHRLKHRLRARSRYLAPPITRTIKQNTLSPTRRLEVFHRDGFIDRYEGTRLIFPGVLWLLTGALPAEFPYHKNWKISECHHVWWYYCPTVDHRIPVVRGGTDDTDNLITTSMLNNMEKDKWTLDEVGWGVCPRGNIEEWDGLLFWFLQYVERERSVMNFPHISEWSKAARMLGPKR